MSTRERIIEAAMGVFIRHGYRLASMELVGREAGLTRQALYHHFDTKEALFRAVIVAVKEGAFEAASAAGLEQEKSGRGLAGVLVAQIAAKERYFAEIAKGSPHVEELLSEHQRQTGDLYPLYAERELRMFTETIDRFRARGMRLETGTASDDLARCIQIAARCADKDGAFADLDRIIHLLVRGAVLSPSNEAISSKPGE